MERRKELLFRLLWWAAATGVGWLALRYALVWLLPFLLVLPRFWGQDGIWASLPLADVLSFIVTLLFIRRFLKYYRLKNRHYLVPGTGKA